MAASQDADQISFSEQESTADANSDRGQPPEAQPRPAASRDALLCLNRNATTIRDDSHSGGTPSARHLRPRAASLRGGRSHHAAESERKNSHDGRRSRADLDSIYSSSGEKTL